MRIKLGLFLLLVTMPMLAHDPEVVGTATIVDDSGPGAPIKMWGTGDVYMETGPSHSKTKSGVVVRLSVEENNLWFQNISDKDITAAIVEILKTDVRGYGSVTVQNIGLFRAGAAGKTSVLTMPSGKTHVAALKKEMTMADYQLKPYVAPTIKAHVLWATFSDGSTWGKERARKPGI